MPIAFQPETVPLQPSPTLKKWSRRESQFLYDHGFFDGQRYELVEGELINKIGQNPPHAFAITTLNVRLVQLFADRLRLQLPIDVSSEDNPTSEPEPDAVVTRDRASAFAQRPPGPGDIAWLIEVSDSTLRFDLTTKANLYARAGIADYWVLDLVNRRVVVHRDPRAGAYTSVVAYAEAEEVTPLLASAVAVRFGELAG